MTAPRFFSTCAALQEHLLQEAGPGTLVLVPHQRLAHQLWHRQRLAASQAGCPAWEPLSLFTLQGWWSNLFAGLWPQEILASPWQRLGRWRQALQAAPAPAGETSLLAWAQALDDTYSLLRRYALLDSPPGADEPPVVAWRRQVTRIFADLLRQEGWLTPAELPAYLLAALREGRMPLPRKILAVGLETPAPMEQAWLEGVSRRSQVVYLRVRGHPQAVQQAVVLPDPAQEVAWVTARLAELARKTDQPLHRLAVTSPEMAYYAPLLQRTLSQVLGPPHAAGGWAYNFSQGPWLAETQLFQAALLPLKFCAGGERREDLVSLLLSPYYGELKAHRPRLPRWDQVFRDQGLDRGWQRFHTAVARHLGGEADLQVLERLEQVRHSLGVAAAPGREWAGRLRAAWKLLGFPQELNDAETVSWTQLTALLRELAEAWGAEALEPGEFLEWLAHGAGRVVLPGPGVQEAGIQVLGLLEMRGLDFDHVFCLGMNSGTLPPPPRPLPLLTALEKRRVLGGTYHSQHLFARELYEGFLGAAPRTVLTRPRVVDQEERVSTPFYPEPWQPAEMALLSVPHPAWLRVPAVDAAFRAPRIPAFPGYPDAPVLLELPESLSLSRLTPALQCPCRFFLEVLLAIRELPEIAPGLDPRERGDQLHKVLARFTAAFRKVLDQDQHWDHAQARQALEAAARQILGALLPDLHWQAEWERWLGHGGLLWEWLLQEERRFREGWRWHGMEVGFAGLRVADCPFALGGRIDRLDCHGDRGDLIVWDYKSGEIPKASKVFDDLEEYQLPCYLLAVEQGLVPGTRPAPGLKAGFIGLKSPREEHLKHEDFETRAQEWPRVLAEFAARLAALGRRLAAGDFSPNPTPAPEVNNGGACLYCGYGLVCGYIPETLATEEGEEGE